MFKFTTTRLTATQTEVAAAWRKSYLAAQPKDETTNLIYPATLDGSRDAVRPAARYENMSQTLYVDVDFSYAGSGFSIWVGMREIWGVWSVVSAGSEDTADDADVELYEALSEGEV